MTSRPRMPGLRRVLVLLLAVALAAPAALTVLPSQPAQASSDDEFILLYFPHSTMDVEFGNEFGFIRGRFHRGSDIFSPKLTPVVAIADGFVERIKKGSRSGWYVKLRHSDDWESHYMHLNNDTPGTDNGRGGREFAIAEGLEVGDFVAAGDVIGFVGDSGNAEGSQPHTHFELHHNGRAVNPYRYLAAAWERKLSRLEKADVVR